MCVSYVQFKKPGSKCVVKNLFCCCSLQTIRNVVREYAANVGGDEGSGADDAASTEQEKSYMLHLADKF